MQIYQITPYSLENIKTGQFFARSNLIRLVALNRLPYAEIEDTKPGLWNTTYTFIKSEQNERFCHCITLVHDAYSFEEAMRNTETYFVKDEDSFCINQSRPLGFRDSHHFSFESMHALEDDINHLYTGTFSGVFTGGTLFKTFGHGVCHASLLVSRNAEGDIFMIQLVLPIPDQFIVNEPHNLVDIVQNLPLRKAVDPMHMTHAMKIIESEGWSIEQEKENEYRVGKFSPAGQDFSIIMRGDTDADFAESIYAAYEAFDPSTEAYAWLDESGHGKNGAPHDMLEVVTDMNYCKDEIYRLYQAVTHR